jgi:uncharacterized spore protein YtfJ
MPTLTELMQDARESIGAKRVFGEPYEKNGITVIPAAKITGGVGGADGEPAAGGEPGAKTGPRRPTMFGGGYGLSGHPVGAYVIKGDKVAWLPAVDVNRLMLGFQIVMIVFFLTIRTIVKTRARAAAAKG